MPPKPKPGEEAEEEEEETPETPAEEEAEEEETPEVVAPPPAKVKKLVPADRKLLDAADELRGVAKDLRADMNAMKKGGILGKLVGGKGSGEGSGSEDPGKGGSGGEGKGKKEGGGFIDGLRSLFGLDD